MSDYKYGDFKSNNKTKFTMKEQDILDKNRNFFVSNKKYLETMLDIISGTSDISIRVLDWFVANYSKKKNILYRIKNNGIVVHFNVNIEYKNQLNGYSKKYFDPFCRKNKIVYSYKNEEYPESNTKFLTSIGQLNFFYWAIKNKVIRYVEMHLSEIEKDMKEVSKINKERKKIEMLFLSTSDNSHNDDDINKVDDTICSTDEINKICISPVKRSISKSDSDGKSRRQQLSKSIYSKGIKKSYMTIKLDFD